MDAGHSGRLPSLISSDAITEERPGVTLPRVLVARGRSARSHGAQRAAEPGVQQTKLVTWPEWTGPSLHHYVPAPSLKRPPSSAWLGEPEGHGLSPDAHARRPLLLAGAPAIRVAFCPLLGI